MSPKPVVLNPDIKRLLDEGYEVEVRSGYLLVHGIHYVNGNREIRKGTVVTDIAENMGELLPPRDHQVWFRGEFPCHQTGVPIEAIRHTSDARQLWEGFDVQHRFSNKPLGGNFPDYYSKLKSYISIILNEARALDPSLDPCTFKLIPPIEEDSVFRYHDTASSRADIVVATARLSMKRVAIVGLGGTGSYVLDLVAKTPVREIHLFDGDAFLQHNAFRSPGAASGETLELKMPKVAYYARAYDSMRIGVIPHAEYLTSENISELAGFDFVFICVDKGVVRKLISEFLQAEGTSFVDVGMDLLMVPDEERLIGSCRVTLSTPAKMDHFLVRAPMTDDPMDDIYRKNVQVADMNALNAALAVLKWKQFCGFYQDIWQAHHTTFSINSHSLTRDEPISGASE